MDEYCELIHEEMATQDRDDVVAATVRDLAALGVGLGSGPGVRVVAVWRGQEAGDGHQNLAG